MRRMFGFSVSRRVLGWFRVLCLVQHKSEQHRRGFRWRANCSTTKTETSYCWRWNNNDKKKKMQSWIIIVGCWNAFFYSMPVSVRPWCVDDWRKKKRKKLAVSSKLLLECWIEDLDWIENRAKWHILAWFCVSVSEVQMFPPLMGSRRWQTVKMKRRGSTDWRDVLEKSQSLSFLHSLWTVSSDKIKYPSKPGGHAGVWLDTDSLDFFKKNGLIVFLKLLLQPDLKLAWSQRVSYPV